MSDTTEEYAEAMNEAIESANRLEAKLVAIKSPELNAQGAEGPNISSQVSRLCPCEHMAASNDSGAQHDHSNIRYWGIQLEARRRRST